MSLCSNVLITVCVHACIACMYLEAYVIMAISLLSGVIPMALGKHLIVTKDDVSHIYA